MSATFKHERATPEAATDRPWVVWRTEPGKGRRVAAAYLTEADARGGAEWLADKEEHQPPTEPQA